MLERTILLDGFSKTFAMTGWRLGYAAVPAELVDPLTRLIVNSTSCVPPFAQLAGVAALEGPQDAVDEMVAEFRRRRDFLVPALNAIPGISCIEPGGAFYAFPNVSALPIDADELADRLLDEAGVAAARRQRVRQPRRPATCGSRTPRRSRTSSRRSSASRASSPRCRRARRRRRYCRSMPGFVDVHSHVVPSGDDGAALDRGGARALPPRRRGRHRDPVRDAARARALGLTTRERPSATRSTRRRSPRCGTRSPRWGLDLRRGWEVFPSEIAASDPAELVLEGTRAVLIEFPGSGSSIDDPIAIVAEAARVVEAAGLVPVLAHPERCRPVAADPESVRPLAERGWLLCLNAPSLVGGHGATAERTAWALLEAGLVALAASDAPLRRAAADPRRRLRGGARAAAATTIARPLFDGSALPWAELSRVEPPVHRRSARRPRAGRSPARSGGSRRSRCSPSTATGGRR